MEKIVNAVQGFFERYPFAGTLGKVTSSVEIEGLPRKTKNAIPDWYKELLFQFPIANLPLGIPNDFGQAFLKSRPIEQLPLMEITFHSIDKIVKISESIFPNNLLFKKKIISVAEDQGSTGEGIFIDTRQEDPPVMLIFHDMGESIKDLIRKGERLADRFSDLFISGKLTNDKIKLTSENQKPAKKLIESFFNEIDDKLKTSEQKLINDLSKPRQLFESIKQRDIAIKDGDYILGLLKLEYGLYDSGYPLTKNQLDKLIDIYMTCNLHVPELVFFEERISNYGG